MTGVDSPTHILRNRRGRERRTQRRIKLYSVSNCERWMILEMLCLEFFSLNSFAMTPRRVVKRGYWWEVAVKRNKSCPIYSLLSGIVPSPPQKKRPKLTLLQHVNSVWFVITMNPHFVPCFAYLIQIIHCLCVSVFYVSSVNMIKYTFYRDAFFAYGQG